MIKNYTSDVPAMLTIARIENMLAEAGVTGIAKEYGPDSKVSSLAFRLPISNDKTVAIRLPANVDAVYGILLAQISKPRKETYARVRQQSERTAWKLMQDWTQVQLSLIAMKQCDALQVFLPYVHDGKSSFYDRIRNNNFLALTA